MFILIGSVILLGVGIYLVKQNYCDFSLWLGLWLIIVCGSFLFVCVIGMPIQYYGTISEILKFEATAKTIETARLNGVELENAAIQHKIIEANMWLADIQYWNETIFDSWIPDAVMELKPIK